MWKVHLFFIVSSFAVACGSSFGPSVSKLSASGDYALSNMSSTTKDAIIKGCGVDYKIIAESKDECYLIMAGVTVREASWKENKSCEAWDQPSNPACGLTQSRKTDCESVGLTGCDKIATDPYLNIRTGLRNIGCYGEVETICKERHGSTSIPAGIKKHLGNNPVLDDYIATMKKVYERADVRKHFGVDSSKLRSFDTVLK